MDWKALESHEEGSVILYMSLLAYWFFRPLPLSKGANKLLDEEKKDDKNKDQEDENKKNYSYPALEKRFNSFKEIYKRKCQALLLLSSMGGAKSNK